ncbi:MAG TPA: TonB-dependent receptor [Pyrinomonadaceae bacterium]|nr:TonB-dependent receptor [Pyrinomonadaceae bacterium]
MQGRKLFSSSLPTALPFKTARIFACSLWIICCLTVARSQSVTALEFVVQDQTGAPIVGAKIVVKTASAIIQEGTTGDDGRFALGAATQPDAVLEVRAEGFANFERRLTEITAGTGGMKIVLAPAPLSEQVTVTATRTETRLAETAASVVSISSTELAATAAATLDDALRQVPGFSLFRRSGSRTANPTSQGVSLRGVGASGASRAVVLADGIPLNDPFGGWVYWSRVPRASIGSIEVLRGGASHLYGSGALGGVVNIFQRKAAAPTLLLETSYGNEQTVDASLFAAGHKGHWGASLGVETFHTDGYILVDEDERGRVDVPANTRSAVAKLTVERKLSNTASVFAAASVFGEARSNGTPFQINRTHLRQFSIGGGWQDARAGSFSARAYGGTQVFDQNFSAVSSDRSAETPTRVQRVPAQSVGFSVQWSRVVLKRQTLIAGLEGREVRGASDEIAFIAGRPSSLVGAGGRERTLGLFFEDIMRLTPKLFVTMGARFDRWRNFAALSASRPISPQARTTSTIFPNRTEAAFSPQLSLLYRPAENFSLYASATRAFRQPTLNELYRSFRVGDVLTLSNENLRAERLTGGEAGTSFGAFNRKLSVRTALFWTEITRPVANVTLSVQPGLITRQRQNLGRTRSRGLELEWDARLTDYLSVSGGYLFSDATVLRFPANRALEGLLIPQVARHQLTVQARYANPSLLTVGLQARASGGQFDDDQNQFRLEKYFTLDALVSRRLTRRVEAFAAVENLFNERYSVGLTPVRTIGPPLLARFGFRFFLGSR